MNVCQGWCTWRGMNRSYEEKCWSYKRRFWKDTGGPVNCCHCSVTKLYLTVCDPMDCSMPGSSVFHCLPGVFKFIFIESVMLSNHLIFCHPLLLPSIFPASASFLMSRFFTAGGQSIGASASVLPMSPSNQPSGLISLRIGHLDLLTVQRTLKSLLQYQNLKTSIVTKHQW